MVPVGPAKEDAFSRSDTISDCEGSTESDSIHCAMGSITRIKKTKNTVIILKNISSVIHYIYTVARRTNRDYRQCQLIIKNI